MGEDLVRQMREQIAERERRIQALRARFDKDEWDVKHSRNLDDQSDVPWLEPEWVTRDRLLAEVAAKRAILNMAVALLETEPDGPVGQLLMTQAGEHLLEHLAAPYGDRPN